MENQPDQQSSPYQQYSQYPQYPPPDPYAQAPSYPPQSPYPTPPAPSPYAPSPYPPQPGGSPYPPQSEQSTYPPQPYPAPGQPYPYGSPSGPNYQQPRKPKNYLWLIIVVVVLVVLVGGLAVAVAQSGKGNSGKNQTASATATSAPTQAGQQATAAPTTAPTTAPTQPSSTSGPHKIGDVVSIDNWQISVLNAKISHGGQYDTFQHAGDVYLEIDVVVTNQTGQSQNFSSLLSCTLKDSTGQSYNSTFASDAPSSPDGAVTNGGKLRGTVVYEVPATMHSFEFDVAPDSLNSSNVAVWNLNV